MSDELPAGRTLDMEIAEKVMAWDHVHDIDECEDPFYSYCRNCGTGNQGWDLKQSKCERPPHYSTDITAAWQVIERLKSRGLVCDLNGGSFWWVRFTAAEDVEYSASCLTAPLAICRAALKAVAHE